MSHRPPPPGWRVPQVPRLQIETIAGTVDDYDRAWGGQGRHEIRDDFARLYALDAGTARVAFADGTRLELRPGLFALIPAGRAARYHCTEPMRLAWVHFRVEILPMIDLFARWTPPLLTPCDGPGRETMTQLLNDLGTHTPHGAFSRCARLLDLLQPFLPDNWEGLLPPSEHRRRLQPALDAIIADLAHPWCLAELARRVHLHPTYFSNLFRQTFGTPPLRYLAQLRARRARDLLSTSEQRIGEIADQCGFRDPLQFSRFFHRICGVSPTDYRDSGGRTRP